MRTRLHCKSINGWIAIPMVRCGICAVSTLSFAVPPGPQTVVVMDKFADMNWSFSELLAAGEGNPKIARYISWIVGTYATPAVKDPQN